MYKLYGVPLSQPFRSVAWALLQRHVRFEIKVTVPGANSKMGSLNEAFLSKTKGRTGQVPILEDGDGVAIAESPAIMMYLAERHEWSGLYGSPGTARKALMDSYMHWHHRGTRQLAKLARAQLRPDLKEQVSDQDKKDALGVLDSLENGWLQGGDMYIAGGEHPSLADLLAYEEVAQVHLTGLLPEVEEFPNVNAWVTSMSQLPFHEEAHKSLVVLGDLSVPSETPMAKRLGAATKAGVEALKKAQDTFASDSG